MDYTAVEDVLATERCQTCDGPLMYLGALGSRLHFRCRDCGIDHSVTVDHDVTLDIPGA